MKNKYILILLVIVCLFVFTGCNKSDKNKLVEGVDYKINNEFRGNNIDISKRGYYIETSNETNSPYFYIICMGQQYTGGYDLLVKEVNKIDEKTEVIIEEIIPDEDAIVTMALESPTITLEFSKQPENIIIKNTKGEVFDKLN